MFRSLLLACSLAPGIFAADAPRVVGTPPADGGRGLVRAGPTEIRHYSGDRNRGVYLVSNDNGETWREQEAPASYPPNFGGIPKEAPAFAQNPRTTEWIRIQPVGSHVFVSKGGIDGDWLAVTKDGRLTADWKENRDGLLKLDGILRSPIFVNDGKRILIPTHGAHRGTEFYISDDGGLHWRKSRSAVSAPPHRIGGEHLGVRWRNSGVEASVVELKDGRLWMLCRTSQDQHYEAFSSDYGDTWTAGKPSRFYGTLTMPTTGRLPNGNLIVLWTNTHPLPELKTATKDSSEDAFTNRDSHHAAISKDEGKTWLGFREIILDEHRNRGDYGTFGGPQDRGKHQSEFLPLDANRILISLGQHANHRKLVIFDPRWLEEKSRSTSFENGLDDWTCHTFIPKAVGHVSYNRKPAAELIDHPDRAGAKAMRFRFLDDPELVNPESGADYRAGGATWNFPNGEKGTLHLRFQLPAGSGGARLSLTDNLFNACDVETWRYAMFHTDLTIAASFGAASLASGRWHVLTFQWTGVGKNDRCQMTLDGKPAGSLAVNRPSPNGISYIHLSSLAASPDSGVIVDAVNAVVE